MSDRHKSFADIAPRSSVHQRNAPVWGRFAQNLDLLAEIRDDAIAGCRLLVVQEIVLDDVGLVSEAKNEIPMTVLAIVLHDMPQNRLVPDRHHRLWNALRVFANTGAQPPQNKTTFMTHVLEDLSLRHWESERSSCNPSLRRGASAQRSRSSNSTAK